MIMMSSSFMTRAYISCVDWRFESEPHWYAIERGKDRSGNIRHVPFSNDN